MADEAQNSGVARPVMVNGVIYPSITKAAQEEGVATATVYDMIHRGSARYITEDQSDGMPIFKNITTSKPLKAALRRREREAGK